MRFVLERQVRFLCAQWTETYLRCVEGAAQQKIMLDAKSAKTGQALLGLNWRGAEGIG